MFVVKTDHYRAAARGFALHGPGEVGSAGGRGSLIIRLSQRRFGVLCLLAYVFLSWSARFDMRLGAQGASLVYPLDTFSMYGRMPEHDTSYPLLRGADGTEYRITDFSAFACREPITGPDAACADARGILYHYEEMAEYIRRHPGDGDQPVELVTRTWTLHPGSAPEPTRDCVIAHCLVRR